MKKWEKELRARLEREVTEGAYNISTKDMLVWTGKGGYIDLEVEMQMSTNHYQLLNKKQLTEKFGHIFTQEQLNSLFNEEDV